MPKKIDPALRDRSLTRRTVDGPNQLWLTDITEHPTGEGKLYLCAVKDVDHASVWWLIRNTSAVQVSSSAEDEFAHAPAVVGGTRPSRCCPRNSPLS